MALSFSSLSIRAPWKYKYHQKLVFSKGLHSLVNRLVIQEPKKVQSISVFDKKKIHGPQVRDEYTKEANYPPLKQYKTSSEEEEAKLVQCVKTLETVEEKLYHMNKPKYYGWQSVVLDATKIQPTSLEFVQYVTNTTTVENELPSVYNLKTSSGKELDLFEGERKGHGVKKQTFEVDTGISTELSGSLEARSKAASEMIEQQIRNFILDYEIGVEKGFEVKNDKILYYEVGAAHNIESLHKYQQERINAFVRGIHKIVISTLATMDAGHLSLNESTVDYSPRNEAFWFRGPIDADVKMVRKREGHERTKAKHKGLSKHDLDQTKIHEPYDRAIQFIGNAILQVRCKKSIPPILSKDDDLCVDGYVPEYAYDPKYLGYPRLAQFGTNLSGHWTGVDKEFCHLQLVSNFQETEREVNSTSWHSDSTYNERQDMLTSKSILSSFGQCLAQACFQGFSPLNDPVNPITNQTIVTDGRKWKFSVYQLNKSSLQGLSESNQNMLRNVCWHLPELELYSHVDIETKEVVGFNPVVLKTLIKFYLMEPTLSDVENEEYLGERKHLFNVKDNYNRQYLHEALRMMYSKRPRMLRRPSIEPYQRLFYLRHPTIMAPMGLREQPWFIMKNYDFKGKEHWDPEFKQFDYHNGQYVPKKFRPARRNPHKIHPGAKSLWRNKGKIVTTPIPQDKNP